MVIKNIYFAYPSRPNVQVLKDFSLSVNEGETVALVGSSGCGKTTVMMLLERFYEPQSGDIVSDFLNFVERPFETLDIHTQRASISMVI